MSVLTVLENRDAREGSRSAFPTKMEVTTVDEPFAMVEGFAPFFRAIANVLKTVILLRFGFSPSKRRISFGDQSADQAILFTPEACGCRRSPSFFTHASPGPAPT